MYKESTRRCMELYSLYFEELHGKKLVTPVEHKDKRKVKYWKVVE